MSEVGETKYKSREQVNTEEGLPPTSASGLFILLVLKMPPTSYFQRHPVC